MQQQIKEFDSLMELLEELDRKGIYGYQRYKTVNRFVSMKARYRDVPVKGSFELTPLCNLDCKMCYVHLFPKQMGANERLRTIEEWKQIIQQAADAGMIYASLTGGECLTYPGFKEVYLYLYSLGIQPDILTNGRLLTEEMIAFFKQYPPAVIQVSLYGSNEDAYEAVTGHRAFQEVIDGIERVKEARLNLVLAVTPNRYMQKDAAALLDLVHSFNVPYVVGDTTLQAREETGRNLAEYRVELEAARKIKLLERDYALNQKTIAQVSIPITYLPVQKKKLNGLPCGGAHSSFHVNWRGELCPCIGYAPSVHCDVLKEGFAEAWKQIVQRMHQYAPPAVCQSCDLRQVCMTCPAEKTYGVLNGELNHFVCERLRQYTIDHEAEQLDQCTLD